VTVTTFSFTYSGGIEDWVVPFHTGTIRLDVVGGNGGSSSVLGVSSAGGGLRDRLVLPARGPGMTIGSPVGTVTGQC
jgi:hypothetical protein